MSYIEKSLGQGEAVVGKARFHWWYTFKALVLLSLFVIPAIGFIILLERPGSAGDHLSLLAICLIAAGIALPGVWIFLHRMIRKWTTEIAVTSHRFVIKTGLFRLDTNEIALHNIEGVRVHQNIWGRILGYGKLRIEGTGVDAIEIPNIARPVDFRRAIETGKVEEPSRN
jgi:hypothetical protein